MTAAGGSSPPFGIFILLKIRWLQCPASELGTKVSQRFCKSLLEHKDSIEVRSLSLFVVRDKSGWKVEANQKEGHSGGGVEMNLKRSRYFYGPSSWWVTLLGIAGVAVARDLLRTEWSFGFGKLIWFSRTFDTGGEFI